MTLLFIQGGSIWQIYI